METTRTLTPVRRYLPTILWILAIAAIYLFMNSIIAGHAGGITLTGKIILDRTISLLGFLLTLLAGLALMEIYFYQIFFRKPKSNAAAFVVRVIQILLAVLALISLIGFFEKTDLIRLGSGTIADFFRSPATTMGSLTKALVASKVIDKSMASTSVAAMGGLIIFALYVIIHFLTVHKNSHFGLAYLLVLPAFLGVLFLIIYPFLFEIKLAFSNASLGTQATKNAAYGLQYGWANLVTLFTGSVAKDAKFFDVFWRTILWTVINVTFHVCGGMALALLLNRPMKLQGFYRTLLIIPWAIPTTIAAMSLRNEFDSRYGVFNIILGNINAWLVHTGQVTVNLAALSNFFNFLAAHIGPVPWKQDPTWAFVSVLIVNIWLGIPFMAVIILGGLQSISREYYEAAEIDGAGAWQQFRSITIPLLRPVLVPAIVLGVVWTFNKFDVIYLITQGGPQEKTDILVSSMYKAAFQFYRYGFTAMFALVIFFILFIFTLVFLRLTGGLKSATE